MPIPTPGFTSANVATEAGISPPWNSNNAAVLALLADGALPYNSGDLAGRSATDYIPNAMDWSNIIAPDDGSGGGTSDYVENSNQTLAGINAAITLQISVPSFNVNRSGASGGVTAASLDIIKNGTVVSTLTKTISGTGSSTTSASTTVSVSSGDTLRFAAYCSVSSALSNASGGGGGTVSVINQSSSNTVLDTFTFSMSADSVGGI